MVSQTAMVVTTTNSWTITNLGPITAAWTPPPSCYETTTWNSNLNTLYIYDLLPSDDWNCMPPIAGKTSNYPTPNFPSIGFGNLLYYWPATCPNGWSTANTNAQSTVGNVTACCPTRFGYNGGLCEHVRPDGTGTGAVITNIMDASDRGHSPTTVFATTLSVVPSWLPIWAYPIYIMEQPGYSASTQRNSSVSLLNSHTKHLSGGAKAGIAVSILVVVFSISAGVFFYFRRRGLQRRQRQSQQELTGITNGYDRGQVISTTIGHTAGEQTDDPTSSEKEPDLPEYKSSFSRDRIRPEIEHLETAHDGVECRPSTIHVKTSSAVVAAINPSPSTRLPPTSDYRLGR
ncbi:uncharacterized protein LY89DRAFT_730795 [Mollisia scopiformis]|uniref:Uncharacterized protein n=1 Tax=Mollisia scopiformis TaxID=149040 RepID=A0A194XKS4_MOLSC|nr:uncharacterized protein LY89DRAFT_730795 [Mollisia scopiformis]KUJ20778.1 hypothetical protein LY89DRAFT_730795 [Mollisia scopiformis]